MINNIDLSNPELEGTIREEGYYGYYTEHSQSNSIGISDSGNTHSEILNKFEQLSIKSDKLYSEQSHYFNKAHNKGI